MNLKQVKKLCQERGIALTPLRAEVLGIIYTCSKPVGAYDLLRKLRKSRPNAEPPTIYRTLDFLENNNLVHRLDSTNTYTACNHPESVHHGQFLLCTACGNAIEVEDKRIKRAITACAGDHEFKINRHPTEIHGLCVECQAE